MMYDAMRTLGSHMKWFENVEVDGTTLTAIEFVAATGWRMEA